MRLRPPHRLVPGLALLLLAGCASAPAPCADCGDAPCVCAADSMAARLPAFVDAPNLIVLGPGVAGSGPPALAEIPLLSARGYAAIVDLRQPSEKGYDAERAAAKAAGLLWIPLPVSGSNLDLADAAALRQALAEAPSGDVLLHCGSGSRAGALWALMTALDQGLLPPEAESLAVRSGAAPQLGSRVRGQLAAAHHD